MRRREFLGAFGGVAAAWPLAAHAQQPAMPVVGFLSAASSAAWAPFVAGFLKGLHEVGFIDGQNIRIEYRWAEGRLDRLPGFAEDLVQRKVAAIFTTGGSDPAKAAMTASTTIPIVFVSSADPVKTGIVQSFNRPGANVTGISLVGSALEGKRLGLLNELIPGTEPIGILVHSSYPDVDAQLSEVQEGASAIRRRIIISQVSTAGEIDAAFTTFAREGASALVVTQAILFGDQREHLATLAARYKLPTIYSQRGYTEVGGLISYGTNFVDSFRQAGTYVGKILKGSRPGELPVLQPTNFELVINLGTAKVLGLTVPPTLLARADEVIE